MSYFIFVDNRPVEYARFCGNRCEFFACGVAQKFSQHHADLIVELAHKNRLMVERKIIN